MGSREQGLLRGLFDFFVAPIPKSPPNEAPRLMRITLAGVPTEYFLHRARRKSVSMAIAREGLVVRAPMRLAQREIDAVLQGRGQWIVDTLKAWRERTLLVAATYHDGGSILFRGKRLKLRVIPALFESFEATESEILIASPSPLAPAAQKAAIEEWMRSVAQSEFAPQIAAMAQALEVNVKTIKLTDTKTMWGSCTSAGVVRLTFRLIQLPPKLAHYVMAHEVSHLREMNHSPKFWAWVRVLDPHYKANRRTLSAYTPLLEE